MNTRTWQTLLELAHTDPDFCAALAQFLTEEQVAVEYHDGYEIGYAGLDGSIARWTAEDLARAEVGAQKLKELFE